MIVYNRTGVQHSRGVEEGGGRRPVSCPRFNIADAFRPVISSISSDTHIQLRVDSMVSASPSNLQLLYTNKLHQ